MVYWLQKIICGGYTMEKMKRAIHLDFHTMPGIYDFEETFDAAEFAQALI